MSVSNGHIVLFSLCCFVIFYRVFCEEVGYHVFLINHLKIDLCCFILLSSKKITQVRYSSKIINLKGGFNPERLETTTGISYNQLYKCLLFITTTWRVDQHRLLVRLISAPFVSIERGVCVLDRKPPSPLLPSKIVDIFLEYSPQMGKSVQSDSPQAILPPLILAGSGYLGIPSP